MFEETLSNTLADLSNLSQHFVRPFHNHQHGTCCLFCKPQEVRTSANAIAVAGGFRLDTRLQKNHNARDMAGLVPLLAPSDLDLAKTGSNAIRQIVAIDMRPRLSEREEDRNIKSGNHNAIQQLCNHLQLHLGYHVCFEIPELDPDIPFKVLVMCITTNSASGITFEKQQNDQLAILKSWLVTALRICAHRIVLVCSNHFIESFFKEIFLNDTRVLLIGCIDTEETAKKLTHALMVTEYRLMPQDFTRFGIDQNAVIVAPQTTTCLFL